MRSEDRPRRKLEQVLAGGAVVIAIAAALTYVLTRREIDVQPPTTTALQKAPGRQSVLDPKDIVEVVAADSIPAIDDPAFIRSDQATWLSPREPVIAFEHGDAARAYPLQIMTWHEIVNDVVAGRPVVITFCPLCNTALAFERPTIEGHTTTFGVSGKLINSNLLMYDRATNSLWPQVTGVALKGPLKESALERLPVQIVSWSDFREAYPEGLVLGRDTGHDRPYGDNPYPGYDEVGKPPFLYSGETDGRLAAVERVIGVEGDHEFVAFPYFRLRDRAENGASVAQARVGSQRVVVFWQRGTASALDAPDIASSRDVGSAAAFLATIRGKALDFTVRSGRIFDLQTKSRWDMFGRAVAGRLSGRQLRDARAVDSFWFDWAAFHPETKVWGQ
ncbi:MAG: DUF3179 domain-containing protein [Actinomycetota bacterium]|nr:DUF3179 domain-containing protein [Actinomycetota bacterium]